MSREVSSNIVPILISSSDARSGGAGAASALLAAARNGDAFGVQRAARNGANAATASYGGGRGAVHLAAAGGYARVLRVLIAILGRGHEAFSKRDDGGDAPLHLAARSPAQRSRAAVQVLIDAGAWPSVRDSFEKTAEDIAWDMGNSSTAMLLGRSSGRSGG